MKYAGVRSYNRIPIDDIGINYFGSSKYITKKYQKENPYNFEYTVIELFKTRELAEMGEHKMLTENNAANSKMWYNRCNGFKDGTFNNLGNNHTEATKKKKTVY
jgi:hypothetical protein